MKKSSKIQNKARKARRSSANYDYDSPPNEKEALATGLALVNAKWDGDSDFAKGMRILQEGIGLKK
jgi:hypothetical protein